MNDGFIKLHRKFLDWEWYRDINTKVLFIHLLFKANWKNGKFEGYELPRGSLITGRKELAKETGISEQSIRTSLNKLKSTNEITIKTTSKFSIISIKNYDLYQTTNQQLTSNQPATNQQLTTIEESKKERKEEYITTTTLIGQNLFEIVEKNFGRTLSPIEIEEIKTWEDNELTRFAISEAVLRGKYSIKYISRMLFAWKKANITSVQQARQSTEEFKKQKQNKNNFKYKSRYDREQEAIKKFLEEEDND